VIIYDYINQDLTGVSITNKKIDWLIIYISAEHVIIPSLNGTSDHTCIMYLLMTALIETIVSFVTLTLVNL
jgi:hypothetical protein